MNVISVTKKYWMGLLLGVAANLAALAIIAAFYLGWLSFGRGWWRDVLELVLLGLVGVYLLVHFWGEYRKWMEENNTAEAARWLEQRQQDQMIVAKFLEDLITRSKEEIILSLKELGLISRGGAVSHQFVNLPLDESQALVLMSLLVKFAPELTDGNKTVLFLSIARLLVLKAEGKQDRIKKALGSIREKDPTTADAIGGQISAALKEFRAPFAERKDGAIKAAKRLF